MNMADLYELLTALLTSAGLLGGTVGTVLAVMLKRARRDAEKKHAERIAMELQRQEGEERLSRVVLALARLCGDLHDAELTQALQEYNRYLDERRILRDEIVSGYTVK